MRESKPSPTQLYRLAAQGKIKLSQSQKDRLSTDLLFVLAITNSLTLNQHDKTRFSPLHLAHLAVTEKIHLGQEDKDRLPADLLFELFLEGFADLSDVEIARLPPEQLEYLRNLKANCPESPTAV